MSRWPDDATVLRFDATTMRMARIFSSSSLYRRGAGLFVPTDISGLVLWLEADKITGLSDGDPVATWTDASGNGYDATQSTESKRPIYKVNIFNGHPVVRFDGTDDWMQNASLSLAQPLTIFAVVNITGTAGSFQQIVDGSGAARAAIYRNNAAPNKIAYYAGTVNLGSTSLTIPTGRFIATGVFNGVSSALYYDGVSEHTGNAGAQGLTAGLGIAAVDGTSVLSGDIAAVLIYNAALSAANLGLIHTYLGNKYGITVP